MSANDVAGRHQFAIEGGQFRNHEGAEDVRELVANAQKQLEGRLRIMHPALRNASITVGEGDFDVIYGQVMNASQLLADSTTVPRRLSQRRIAALKQALEFAVAVFEESGRNCRECGCWEWDACANGCWWVTDDLCSSCAPAQLRRGMGH